MRIEDCEFGAHYWLHVSGPDGFDVIRAKVRMSHGGHTVVDFDGEGWILSDACFGRWRVDHVEPAPAPRHIALEDA